jgi:hypothetical protein
VALVVEHKQTQLLAVLGLQGKETMEQLVAAHTMQAAVVVQVPLDKLTQAKVEQEFKTQSLALHTSGQAEEQALDTLHALVTAEEAEAAVVPHELAVVDSVTQVV